MAFPGLMRRRRCAAEHPRFLTRGLNKVKAETALSVLATTFCEQSIWLAPRVLGPVSPEPHKKRGPGSPEPLISTQPAIAGVLRIAQGSGRLPLLILVAGSGGFLCQSSLAKEMLIGRAPTTVGKFL
jgi:hypothetical protein